MAALGTRSVKIKIGATEYTAQVSRAVITSGEGETDFVTFADAAAGGAREYRFEFTAVQDMAAGTIWDQVFASAGTSVAVVYNPYGVATATATQPFFNFNATITEPDGDFIGGEANASTTARMTFECSWVLAAKPTKAVTGTF